MGSAAGGWIPEVSVNLSKFWQNPILVQFRHLYLGLQNILEGLGVSLAAELGKWR